MTLIPKPIRIEPAFDNREQVCAMFERHAPCPALATYLPEDSWFPSATSSGAKPSITPMFRGNWAVGGKPLVERCRSDTAQQDISRGRSAGKQ